MLQKTLPKAPCLIAKRMPHTTLTIVCTINVSIDCECFDVSNPSERKNIHRIKSSQWDAWFVFCFLK